LDRKNIVLSYIIGIICLKNIVLVLIYGLEHHQVLSHKYVFTFLLKKNYIFFTLSLVIKKQRQDFVGKKIKIMSVNEKKLPVILTKKIHPKIGHINNFQLVLICE